MRFINIEKEKRTKILEKKIDAQNFLSMNKERGLLIKYGIAMGLDNPKELKNKESLYRPEYVRNNPELLAIIACTAIEHMKSSDDLNDVLDSVKMFNLADECLNRGLDVIEYQIDNVPTNNYRLHLIEELEELYNECVND